MAYDVAQEARGVGGADPSGLLAQVGSHDGREVAAGRLVVRRLHGDMGDPVAGHVSAYLLARCFPA